MKRNLLSLKKWNIQHSWKVKSLIMNTLIGVKQRAQQRSLSNSQKSQKKNKTMSPSTSQKSQSSKKRKGVPLYRYIFSLVFQLREGVFNEKGRGEEFSLSRNVRNNGALFNGTRSHCVSADNCDGIQKKFRFAFDWKSITGPFVRIEWPEMTLLQCKK